MSDREKRVARNESASREINEQLERAHEEASPDQHIRMVCECGQDACDRLVAITIPEYERLRRDPRQFVVVRDHVMGDVEEVVLETERFTIVAKREGTAAAVATEEDPRG